LSRQTGAAASVAGTVYDPGGARRWRMKRAAEGILCDKKPVIDRYGETRAHFQFRVAMCHRGTDGAPPAIKRSPDRMHARYAGLQSCGSVWHCPICAPKVAAGRRDEMNEAIAAHLKSGGDVYLATYTLQHDAEKFGAGKLADELGALAKALSALKGSRAYRDLLGQVEALGTIRALEVTFGEMNGWHCHTHELIFAGRGQLELLRGIRDLWAAQLVKRDLAGLKPGDIGEERQQKLLALLERCFVVEPGDKAAQYVAKFGREPETERGAWGIASEMTRGHLKRGRSGAVDEGQPQRCGHVSPWGLLNDYVDGDARSGVLWREFAIAFQGRRQLFWSRDLRKHFFGIVERSDEELAAEPDKRCSEYVCSLPGGQWATVLEHNARHELLRVAAEGGADAVREFVEQLKLRGREGLNAEDLASGHYDEGRSVFLRRVA
jgi:hypothetical protein